MTTNPDPLNDIQLAYEATTKGEWTVDDESPHRDEGLCDIITDDEHVDEIHIAYAVETRDLAFITLAHTHLPAVLAEVERLRAEVARLNNNEPAEDLSTPAPESPIASLAGTYANAPFMGDFPEFLQQHRGEINRLNEDAGNDKEPAPPTPKENCE